MAKDSGPSKDFSAAQKGDQAPKAEMFPLAEELLASAVYLFFLDGFAYDVDDPDKAFDCAPYTTKEGEPGIALTAGYFKWDEDKQTTILSAEGWTKENHKRISDFLDDLSETRNRFEISVVLLENEHLFFIGYSRPEDLIFLLRKYAETQDIHTLDFLENAHLVPRKKTISQHGEALREKGEFPFDQDPGQELDSFDPTDLPIRPYVSVEHALIARAKVREQVDIPLSFREIETVLEQERGTFYPKPSGTRGEFGYH
jgi:hypothetical protein